MSLYLVLTLCRLLQRFSKEAELIEIKIHKLQYLAHIMRGAQLLFTSYRAREERGQAQRAEETCHCFGTIENKLIFCMLPNA